MIGRTWNIIWKELAHMRKDRILIPFLMIGAIAELALVAWATSQPIELVPMTVVDLDQSVQSAALIAAFDATDEIAVTDQATDEATARAMMDDRNLLGDSQTVIAVIISDGYAETLAAGDQPTVNLLVNGAESMSGLTAERAAQQVIFEQGMRERYNLEPADYADQIPQITVRYNEDLNRSWYTLPAEAALMFYMITMVIAALAVSREREKGTYEQLLVMPYRALEVVAGKALAPMIVGYVLFLSMLGLMVFVFDVPVRGSLPLLLMLAVLYLAAEIGKGVLLSMIARTQLQALLLVFSIVMFDLIFSGFAVAIETMPPLAQTFSNFIPSHHWLEIMRSVLLKDAGLDVLMPNVLSLMLIGGVILAFTAYQYRRATV